jgi:hypothetical protein
MVVVYSGDICKAVEVWGGSAWVTEQVEVYCGKRIEYDDKDVLWFILTVFTFRTGTAVECIAER